MYRKEQSMCGVQGLQGFRHPLVAVGVLACNALQMEGDHCVANTARISK